MKDYEKIGRDLCDLCLRYETCQACNEALPIDGEHCYHQCVAIDIIKHGYVKKKEVVRKNLKRE